jgi:hypothetical protein
MPDDVADAGFDLDDRDVDCAIQRGGTIDMVCPIAGSIRGHVDCRAKGCSMRF